MFFSFSELLPLFRPGKFCFIIVTWHFGRILSRVIYDIWLESGQKRGSAKCHEEFDKSSCHIHFDAWYFILAFFRTSPALPSVGEVVLRSEPRQFLFPFLTILIPKRGSLTNHSCVTRILTGVLITSILMEELKRKTIFFYFGFFQDTSHTTSPSGGGSRFSTTIKTRLCRLLFQVWKRPQLVRFARER